jgi:hypothetical protein
MIYSGSYALAYGIVYATVFVAQSLPQENPVMHGFRDGGGAAMDELNGNWLLVGRMSEQPLARNWLVQQWRLARANAGNKVVVDNGRP